MAGDQRAGGVDETSGPAPPGAQAGVRSLYIEAVVGIANIGSQRIADDVTPTREEITDSVSGLPAYRYVLPVGMDV